MKIKVTRPNGVNETINVKFPISIKENTRIFVHCYDENNCIVVYPDHFNRYGASVALNEYHPKKVCLKSEVEAAFKQTVKLAQKEVFNLIDTTEMNLPVTETTTAETFENEIKLQGNETNN